MPSFPKLDFAGRVVAIIAIVAASIALDPLNILFRTWLRDTVVGGAPYWADHLFFMLTLKVIVWGVVGYLLLGLGGLFLGRPERGNEGWWFGVISGLALTALVGAAIAASGPFVLEWRPNYPLMFANFISNWYEEFIFRGAILGLLFKVMEGRRPWVAIILSALLFCQGHRQYPPVLLATVFVAGVLWAWMTLRYKSLWPAWISHTVADTIADAIFKV